MTFGNKVARLLATGSRERPPNRVQYWVTLAAGSEWPGMSCLVFPPQQVRTLPAAAVLLCSARSARSPLCSPHIVGSLLRLDTALGKGWPMPWTAGHASLCMFKRSPSTRRRILLETAWTGTGRPRRSRDWAIHPFFVRPVPCPSRSFPFWVRSISQAGRRTVE